MPCMYNGRPVKGNKGSCPSGSYWSDTEFDGELNEFADVTNFLKRRYINEDGGVNYFNAITDPLLATGVGGLGLKGALTAGKVGSKGIGSLINKLFMKKTPGVAAVQGTKQVPKYSTPLTSKAVPIERRFPINNPKPRINNAKPFVPVSQKTIPYTKTPAIPAGMKPSIAKMATLGAGGMYGKEYLPPLLQARKDSTLATTAATQTEEQRVADEKALTEQLALAEKQRVEGLGFFDRMKEPGYWDTSLTGVEGDDRMSRLGDLLRYYGMPPSGRANELSPSEQWAQRSIDAATVAAKEAANNTIDSPYAKVGQKTVIQAVTELVQQDYGNTWIPGDVMFGGKLDKKGVESVAARITANIVTLSKMPGNQGLPLEALYEQAKKEYEKNPGG